MTEADSGSDAARATVEAIRTAVADVPGTHVGIEGHLRIWLGGREEYLREGLRRIGTELRALFD